MSAERNLPPVARFASLALAWSLALFALIRLSWFERRFVEWAIEIQRTIALWYGAPPRTSVIVDGSCSGADATALCVAVCLAYPAPWRRRLAGAAGGAALVLALNTVRIGTLLAAFPDRALFGTLHLYVWPAILVLAVAGYTLWWTVRIERARSGVVGSPSGDRARVMRLGVACMALLALHAATAPWTMASESLLTAATWTAAAGGAALSAVGLPASVQGNVLFTDRGVFQVTQECLLTPVLPVYLAAAIALPLSRRTRWLALVGAVPLFLMLGVLRVLVLALPPAIADSPLVLAHGFYQITLGVAVVALVCLRGTGRTTVSSGSVAGRFLIACTSAIVLTIAIGDEWSAAVAALANTGFAQHAPSTWRVDGDVQGALPLLPVFQLGLLMALAVTTTGSWSLSRGAAGVMSLAALQALLLAAVGEAAAHFGLAIHPIVLRASAIGLPVLVWWLFLQPRNPAASATHTAYRSFWDNVGEEFPDLYGAASTTLYFENEVRLWSDHLLPVAGCRVLKSDLWDEAKNTRILQWAADRGAHAYGVDVSGPIVRRAHRAFGSRRLEASLADVRSLPFRDASFDAIYSMGTIEHFDESEAAVLEMSRVLKPGGRIVVGVPNRWDPFLRPLLVVVLRRLSLYAYGFEKSYSRRALRAMVERAGLVVVAETGILFLPGWLRMLDLLAHTRGWKRLSWMTSSAVALFSFVDRRFPRVRRHGYLIAAVAVKPSRGLT